MSEDHLDDEASTPAEYASQVGERLRAIRKQKGLSLQDVEASSTQEFKASVLGAYERGERAISVPRLQRLAAFYNVPVDQLLPRDPRGLGTAAPAGEIIDEHPSGITLDLTRLENLEGQEFELVERYVGMIQLQRQDFNGRVLSIRRDDLRALACLLNIELEEATDRLDSLGLRIG